jgi:hypothetical protein
VNPLITDGVMGLAVLIAAIPSTVDDPRISVDFREPDTLGYLLLAAQCLAVAIRRIRPDIALPISGIGIAAYSELGSQVTLRGLGVCSSASTRSPLTHFSIDDSDDELLQSASRLVNHFGSFHDVQIGPNYDNFDMIRLVRGEQPSPFSEIVYEARISPRP